MRIVDLAERRSRIAARAARELVAYARTGAPGPTMDVDRWAQRHRPAASLAALASNRAEEARS